MSIGLVRRDCPLKETGNEHGTPILHVGAELTAVLRRSRRKVRQSLYRS